MLQKLHEFLSEIKTSPEFRATVTRAAITCGYDPSSGDESLALDLERRVTVLLGEILFELTDDRFLGRTHGRRKTYEAECRGPLCRKCERDKSRKRYQRGNPNSQRNRRRSELDDVVLEYVLKKYNDVGNENDKQELGGAA